MTLNLFLFLPIFLCYLLPRFSHEDFFMCSLQSPSHFYHSFLTPTFASYASTPPRTPLFLLANAATLQHNWSMPKLRQA